MKKVLSMLLVLAMMLSLAACSGSGDTSSSGGTSTDSTGETVKDTFIAALGGQPDYLDPAVAGDSITSTPVSLMYMPLYILDEAGSPVPVAVETCDVSDDGLVYTLKLVDGNKWSDGQPVKASEYEYGTKRSLGMGAGLSTYSYFVKDYLLNGSELEGKDVADMDSLGVKADDEANTLTFTLEAPCPYFLGLLTNNVFCAVRADYAKEHESTWADDVNVPVNGAYRPTKIASNEEIVLEKVDTYIYADDVATPNIILKVMEDMDAQMMAYQNGEIDMALTVDPGVASQLYGDQPDLVRTDSVINYYVQINSASFSSAPALQDVNVRRALQLALNRDEIVSALDAGEAYYPLYGYVPKGIPGVDGDFRTEADEAGAYVYTDVEEAKELLAKAGYGTDNPLKLVYKYNSSTMHDTVAQVMQQQWAEIGVEVTFETVEVQTFFDDRDVNANYEIARGAMSADYMDPTTYLNMFIPTGQQKVVVDDAKYNEMMADAQSTEDPAERLEKLHDVEQYLVEEMAYTIPVFGYASIYLMNPNTTGIGFDPVGNTNLTYVKCTG